MIIGDMEIRLRADIARLQRDMDSARRVVGDATTSISRAADMAKAALAGIAAGVGLSQLVQMSDAYAKFTAQLKLASLSAREYGLAYADVKRIAAGSQQGLQETGVLYARIANGTRELGTAQKQVAAITETVNLSLLVSGATASEAASAQLQLSQAFASGTLRGEEFNAVNEAAPRLMLALADGIGVPVGALKKMAEEGAITSKIMADTLPNALVRLREEAKEVQTISGAFTVLKNNMMEFVGIQSNASGAVAALTGAIRSLSENLALIGVAMAALLAVKVATFLDAIIAKTYASVTAMAAERASLVASAQATVASTYAQVGNLEARLAMIATLRAETMATVVAANAVINSAASDAAKTLALQSRSVAMIELAALGRAQVGVEAALVVSTTVATAATGRLTATMIGATIAARAMALAVWAFANPLAAIAIALGVGATAWTFWSNRTAEANDKALQSTDETTIEMIARLDKQIEKLKERNRLQDTEPRLKGLNDLSDADKDGLARAKADLEAVRAGTGKWAGVSQSMRYLDEVTVLHEYELALRRVSERQDEVTHAANRGRDAKLADWYGQNGTAAQKLAAELEGLRKQFGTIPPEMEKLVRAKYADKGSAAAIKAEATAYQALMTSIAEKGEANKLELDGYDKLSESQKLTIKLDAAISTGKNNLSAASIQSARAGIAARAAEEAMIESRAADASWAEKSSSANADAAESLSKVTAQMRADALAQQDHNKQIGLGKMALADLEAQRYEHLASVKDENAALAEAIDFSGTMSQAY
ncbi:tape measure protein, partial [Massilia sp. CCM 8734]|uniref:tape measure protein n=1 Tax=Massilia sp. CCM 8734 TaxID=2609283 RepID=UPI0014242555